MHIGEGAGYILLLAAIAAGFAFLCLRPPREVHGRVVKRRTTYHESFDRYRGRTATPHFTVDIEPDGGGRIRTYTCDGRWKDALHEGTAYTLLVRGGTVVGVKHGKPAHGRKPRKK